jgi:hypothetical protein
MPITMPQPSMPARFLPMRRNPMLTTAVWHCYCGFPLAAINKPKQDARSLGSSGQLPTGVSTGTHRL